MSAPTQLFTLLFYFVICWQPVLWLWTSPRKRAMWGPCWEGFVQRLDASELQQSAFCGWEYFACCLHGSFSGFLRKQVFICVTHAWLCLTYHRVNWDPQRNKENLHEIFSHLKSSFKSLRFPSILVHDNFRTSIMYTQSVIPNQSFSSISTLRFWLSCDWKWGSIYANWKCFLNIFSILTQHDNWEIIIQSSLYLLSTVLC